MNPSSECRKKGSVCGTPVELPQLFNGGTTSAYLNLAHMSNGDFLGNRAGTMRVFV
jgi:hypothetical protein